MKIENVKIYELEIPFTKFVGDNSGVVSRGFPIQRQVFDSCIIKISTDNGLVGWGSAFAYECRRSVAECIRHMIVPKIIGKNPLHVKQINFDLQKQLHLFGRYGITLFGISAVDLALWDLVGKYYNKSVAEVIGKKHNKSLEGYSSLYRYGDKDQVYEMVKKSIEEGYKHIKLHEITEDEVKASRLAAGNEISIMLDTNCPWSKDEALIMAKKLSEYNLLWLEEPINPPEDFDSLSDIRHQTGIPIASGENACTYYQFKHMIEKEAIDYAQPSVTKVGGVTEFLKIISLCEEENVKLMPHSPYFCPGFLATLHLSQCTKNLSLIERFYVKPEAYLYPETIFDPKSCLFMPPEGIGLGIDPDLDVIKTYKVN